MAFIDLLSILAGFSLAGQIRFGSFSSPRAIEVAAVMLPLYGAFSLAGESYTIDVLKNWRIGAFRALRSLLISACAIFLTAFLLKTSDDYSRILLTVGLASSAALVCIGRYAVGRQLNRRFQGRFVQEAVILDDVRIEVPTGMFAIDAAAAGIRPDTGDPIMLDRLSRLLQFADRVIVACPSEREAAWGNLLKGMDIQGEVCMQRFKYTGICALGKYAGTPTAVVNAGPLSLTNRFLKRCLDIGITLPTLIFLAPCLILVALLIKLDSPGPILFRQQRMGCGNRLFSVYKFRTMKADMCDPSGCRSTSHQDERVTRFGHVLRCTSIDELPQLFNVLLGDMSLVGPRPHALGSTVGDDLFWQIDPTYWHRHTLKPGITGLAQIRGYRGSTHTRSDLTRRLEADLEYVSTWSLARDLSILLRTFGVVMHRNAY
ncbi:sugar transferase [Sphingomonas sp. LY54]|uniref:sugar transferase n=1 Tax=Sphingomonas sp. LY54 TaxID=3095343 RepID=UPI002D782DF1|nr:sugar transferase [Sphingomonas sp. LY54]WRP28202.1 sugar transferase [Sphingomonas sp. LY54]